MTMSFSHNIIYRKEIDGLRALAVLPVILFHAGFEAFSGGFVGVDIFFVISGYLITTIIINELERGNFSIVNFYERRARRILPALFLVMLVCIPFAWFWLLPSNMKDFSQSLVAVSLFASNILFWSESGYFGAAAELKPLLHTWSLAVEEQYYVIFPLFLMLCWKLGKRWILIFLGLIFVASLSAAQWLAYADPLSAFYLLPTRSWELLVGSFAAFYLLNRNGRTHARGLSELGGWLGLALILYAILTYSKVTPFPGIYALAPTLGTLFIILFSTQQTTIGKFIGNKAFVGLGLISYSAYLWHQPLFAFARHRGYEQIDHFVFFLLSVFSVVLAFLSWKFVEVPFRKKTFSSRNGIFALFALFGVFFIFIGYQGHKNNGFESRFERILNGDIGHTEFHQYNHKEYYDCEPKSIAKQALKWEGFLRCKQSKKGMPEVILLGDSHAEHLFLGLAYYAANKNISSYILNGKPYLDNPDFKVIFEELLSNKKSQHILLTMHFFSRIDADGSGLYDGFSSTIQALLDAGKTVTLVGDVPRFNQDPGYCVYSNFEKLAASCAITIEAANQQKMRYEAILSRLSDEFGLRYVRIDIPFCTSTMCAMTNADSVLYRDNNHLNIIGSKIAGKYLAEQLSF